MRYLATGSAFSVSSATAELRAVDDDEAAVEPPREYRAEWVAPSRVWEIRLDVGHVEGLAMTNGEDEPAPLAASGEDPDPVRDAAEAAAAMMSDRRVLAMLA